MLQWLYAQEQNVTITSFWDGGWSFMLGDPVNGFKAMADCIYDLDEGAAWLMEQYELNEASR